MKAYIVMEFNNQTKLTSNSKVELACQHLKKNQLAYLKNVLMLLRMFFYGSSFQFKFSKRLISMLGSCVCSNKKDMNLGSSNKNLTLNPWF